MAVTLTFEKTATEFILASFGKTVDEEGYIVDTESGDRVQTDDGRPIHAVEFAGVSGYPEEYLDDNFVTLVDHVKRGQ